jgi:glycosyltransferase involved in cell wall biosynthesis
MRLLVPYNEILPKKKAHDVYIFQECSCLASLGAQVTLLCGKGSQTEEELFRFYNTSTPFEIQRLPIVRKNNALGLSWNLPFFFTSQREIETVKPDAVILSVLKQATYNLNRKMPGVKYIMEVHEVTAYPGQTYDKRKVDLEREVFEKADLVTVTTTQLKEILLSAPYEVKTPVKVIPLGVSATSLPPPLEGPLTLFYVGQLYEGQGVQILLRALSEVPEVCLKIVGGRSAEIATLQELQRALGLEERVEFIGFKAPSELPVALLGAHGFVAPFLPTGRMPYVAHTKISEYIEWGRPVIVPDLEVTREHFPDRKGALFFEAGNFLSLAASIKRFVEERGRLQDEVRGLSGQASWKKRGERLLEALAGITR